MKVVWLEQSIKYYFENNENIFSKGFFIFMDGITPITKYEIKMAEEYAEVVFENPKINIVSINGNVFLRSIVETPKVDFSDEFEKIENEYDENKSEFTTIIGKTDDTIFIRNNSSEPITVEAIVKTYMKETYPDFAQNSDKKTLKVNPYSAIEVATSVKGKIIEVSISGFEEKVVLDYIPSYYFTNVSALKEYIKDTGLNITNKTDDQLKDKIVEKSTLLKRKFGLLIEHIENFELYPAYKKLVHLYCIYDFIMYEFINGNNGVGSDGSSASNGGLTLGRFSTKGEGSSSKYSSNGSNYLPDLIKNKIADAEDDLRKSIFNKSRLIKNKGGLCNGIGRRIQTSFGNW